jgi:murein DD-endopeptidase MepM/ murein hydrolase activator NlpD
VGTVRRKAGLVLAAFGAAVLAIPGSAASAETRAAQVTARIQAVREALDRIGAALDAAEHDLEAAEDAAARHRQAVATAAARQASLRQALASQAAAMYTLGGGSLLETILAAQDVEEAAARFAYLDQIHARERAMLEELAALRRHAAVRAAELDRAVRAARAARASFAARRAELLANLRELESLQNLLQALGGRGRLSRAPSGFVCPVVGPRYVSNNFGDRRPGGPHTGDDIQADYGQGVVAVLPATVVATPYGSWIGIGIIIRDAAGNEWWYAHLSHEYVSVGQRVAAGELIGRVGCTGRCYGPHLHFEYHPHGGEPVDPYRILSAAC